MDKESDTHRHLILWIKKVKNKTYNILFLLIKIKKKKKYKIPTLTLPKNSNNLRRQSKINLLIY